MVAIALIDTSRAPAWVGVAVGETRRVVELAGGRRAGDRLVSTLMGLVAEVGRDRSRLDALVVVTGPGSFTGLRAGVAAAQGIGRATGVALVGVSGLELAARAASGGAGDWLLPLGAGRRGCLYGCLYHVGDDLIPCAEGAVAEREMAAWREAAPAGCRWLLGGGATGEIADLPSPDRAARLEAAWQRVAAGAAVTPPRALQPLYVRDWMG
jgi:tRNA threonylcarbamoyladenosine biosynthesis protein TsaB